MYYKRIRKAKFIERPNRFIAYVDVDGCRETVHVKNTGRCEELLIQGREVYIQECEGQNRKTKWDLIAVEKKEVTRGGNDLSEKATRLINVDSQIPNKAVKEWIEQGNLFPHLTMIKSETVFKNSRFDLYAEAGEGEKKRRIFIEVKGVTLEKNGACRFPDAPSERAVKHLEELILAKKEGYEAYVFFVIQMEGVNYFTPNEETHPAFARMLKEARKAGVGIIAYDCEVTPESIFIKNPVDVVLESPRLKECVPLLMDWFRQNARDLPWRRRIDAYRVWISEIMLQQTRVEAVKPYYERFLKELPDVKALAEVPEERLLKLWEGLGYYNRARNLQTAARQIMEEFNGRFPDSYEEIRKLKGIGSYTAGAISSFVYNIRKPAVDGNVLRVVTRILALDDDIAKAATKSAVEAMVEEVIPEKAGDFNQSLIELGAIVCLPNGEPRCVNCPVKGLCLAHENGRESEFPVKTKAKSRRIEKRTVLIFRDNEKTAIRKRREKGLLAGLYEFPNAEGHLKQEEVAGYAKQLGIMPVRIKQLGSAKHIFSHVEWHMKGYEIVVDQLEHQMKGDSGIIFADIDELREHYPMPSAFEAYMPAG